MQPSEIRTLFFADRRHPPHSRRHCASGRRRLSRRRDRPDPRQGTGSGVRARHGRHPCGTRLRRTYSALGFRAAGRSPRQRHPCGNNRSRLRQPRFRKGRRRTGGIRPPPRIPPHCCGSIRGRTLVQQPRRSDCRRTPRCRRHGRRNRIRRKHPGQTARRTTCNRRRSPAENTPNAPALPAAIYPFRAGLSAPAAQKSGCTHPRRRRRTLHPVRSAARRSAQRKAIARGDELHTDPQRCIRCCACVKGCPTGARSYETPFADALARNFSRRKPPVTLL